MSQEDFKTSRDQFKRAYEIQKQAREEAELLLEEKSRELYLKNRSLEEALDKLGRQQSQLVVQEKLAAIGQLGAGLAHEINNPNAVVQNNLSTLGDYMEQLSAGLSDALGLLDNIQRIGISQDLSNNLNQIRQRSDIEFVQQDYPALIRESLEGSARITHIANGFRYFANPDLSQKRPMCLESCIEQAQHLLKGSEQLSLIKLNLSECPEILGLPLLVSQAFANLLQNAIDANAEHRPIEVTTRIEEGQILCCIEDQGTGMTEDLLPKIFNPFFTTKRGHNGLGLGICQHIINQHQGSLQIESREGAGTKVELSFPIHS